MAEIRYTVRVTFPDAATAANWLEWLQSGHAAAVIAGGATSAEAFVVGGSPDTYEVVYRFPDRAAFDRYDRDLGPTIRAEWQARFPTSAGNSYQRGIAELLARFG